jgi:hypothetical protein
MMAMRWESEIRKGPDDEMEELEPLEKPWAGEF